MLEAGNQWKLTERSKGHQLVTDNDENVSRVTKFYYKVKPCLKNQRHTQILNPKYCYKLFDLFPNSYGLLELKFLLRPYPAKAITL